MNDLRDWFLKQQSQWNHPLCNPMSHFFVEPTHISSSGFPQTNQLGFQIFRDHIPHLLGMGHQAWLAHAEITQKIKTQGVLSLKYEQHFQRADKLLSTLIYTASVTAPAELWLLKCVLANLAQSQILEHLLNGKAVNLQSAQFFDEWPLINNEALKVDLRFLESRGYLSSSNSNFEMNVNDTTRSVFHRASQWVLPTKERLSHLWAQLFAHGNESPDLVQATLSLSPRTSFQQDTWIADANEIECGAWLVPLILGLILCDQLEKFSAAPLQFCDALSNNEIFTNKMKETLKALGLVNAQAQITQIGERICSRGPGPFGILYAYHPYMNSLDTILKKGRSAVWVRRRDNISASQLANTKTFSAGNAMLDKFCTDHAFSYKLYIEHAMGKGEATRQRYVKNGETHIQYAGADLENEAIDAAQEEQKNGTLPQNMFFVREADIGQPHLLLDAFNERGINPQDAVMIVGNGFHEVREQTTHKMINVFKAYQDAGIILIFTEETGHGTRLLQQTAWNTYHSGFRYVHEKSGQGLRPATEPPRSKHIENWPKSWRHCVSEAGYMYLTDYTHATRQVLPYEPENGFNPAISVTHFCIPKNLGLRLGLN
jgi:hypothetical protein